MKLADLRASLDDELTWRTEELRFLRNRLVDFRNDDERDRFRRAMVVMLYAHFEGFWKAAFMIYVNAVNGCRIPCADASEPLVAASFSDVFEALSDNNRKSDYFRRTAPDDAKLHRFARHIEFAGRVHDFGTQRIEIEAESVVDTESNLVPSVMRKSLFRLGFKHDAFKSHEGTVNKLLNSRNGIAHGSTRSGVGQKDYEELEAAVVDVMKAIVVFVYESLREGRHLRVDCKEYAI